LAQVPFSSSSRLRSLCSVWAGPGGFSASRKRVSRMLCACFESEQTEITEIVAATSVIKPELEIGDGKESAPLPTPEDPFAAAAPAVKEESNEVEAPKAEVEAPKAEVEAANAKKTFEVSVTNSAGDLMGLDFFAAGGGVDYLLASGVKSGPLDLWNKAQTDKSTQLRQYDRIIAVNGEAGTADALKTKLGQKADLKITVERPRLLQFKIERPSAAGNQPLGLPLKFWNSGPGLTIDDIQDSSIIGKYLEAADFAKSVRKGDHLVMLNDKRLNPTSQAEVDACVTELNLPTPAVLALVFRSYVA